MNGFLVLIGMALIYGRYALFDPRTRWQQSGHYVVGTIWLVVTLGALALTAGAAGGAGKIAHPTARDVGLLIACYVVYGILMSLVLHRARLIIVTTPLVLVTHGFALAAIAQEDISFLFTIAVVLTPLVFWVALREPGGGWPGWLARLTLWLWTTLVLTSYTVFFMGDELAHGSELSTALFALPVLLVRVCSFAALLALPLSGGVADGLQAMVARTQLYPMPLLVVLLPALAVGAILAAFALDQAPLGFIVLFGGAQVFAFWMNPPQTPELLA